MQKKYKRGNGLVIFAFTFQLLPHPLLHLHTPPFCQLRINQRTSFISTPLL